MLKRNSKNLLFNIKLLLFIDNEKVDDFFQMIKNKYYNSNENFFKYFENNYMNNHILKNREWNYFNFIKNESDINKYFFTNNVCESLNRTLNSFYKYSKKNFYNFQLSFQKLIEHYEHHIDYIEKNVSITRILSWYCKTHDIKDLQHFDFFKEMAKSYNDHFQYDISDIEIDELNNTFENLDASS